LIFNNFDLNFIRILNIALLVGMKKIFKLIGNLFTADEALIIILLLVGALCGFGIDRYFRGGQREALDIGLVVADTTSEEESDSIGGTTSVDTIVREVVEKGGPVDINSADEKGLQRLKGVGPALAKSIIEYRNGHGKFRSVEGLDNVKGIGPSKLNKMRDQIILGK